MAALASIQVCCHHYYHLLYLLKKKIQILSLLLKPIQAMPGINHVLSVRRPNYIHELIRDSMRLRVKRDIDFFFASNTSLEVSVNATPWLMPVIGKFREDDEDEDEPDNDDDDIDDDNNANPASKFMKLTQMRVRAPAHPAIISKAGANGKTKAAAPTLGAMHVGHHTKIRPTPRDTFIVGANLAMKPTAAVVAVATTPKVNGELTTKAALDAPPSPPSLLRRVLPLAAPCVQLGYEREFSSCHWTNSLNLGSDTKFSTSLQGAYDEKTTLAVDAGILSQFDTEFGISASRAWTKQLTGVVAARVTPSYPIVTIGGQYTAPFSSVSAVHFHCNICHPISE